MIKFLAIEVPIACSMIELAERADHPFQRYFCYWVAFNNIYTLAAQRQGNAARFVVDKKGRARVEKKWTYDFPKVIIPKENEQISAAIQQLDAQTMHDLISHPNVKFFVERTPHGVNGNHDGLGQLINGVLNVSRTINPQSPVWSPIDKQAYERYIARDWSSQRLLTEQIVFLLYTVRNNLVHGSKSPDEANDTRVVEHAVPLLELIVRAFFIN